MDVQLKTGCQLACPGCTHRSWSSQESENQKLSWVSKVLSSWSHVLTPIQGVPEELRWNYRQKTCLHAEWKGDHWAFGLLKKDEVIDIPNCPVHSSLIRNVVQSLSVELPSGDQFPLVFLAMSGTLLTLVIKAKQAPILDRINWQKLGVTGVFLNLNPSAGNRVYFSKGWKCIWGEPWAYDGKFQYGPDSFQQLIPFLHERSLKDTESFLNPQNGDIVIDLYSGIGRSLDLWKKLGCSFIGVELGGEAVRCGLHNIGNGSILRGRVEDRLPQLDDWLKTQIQTQRDSSFLMYLNPPRMGLEKSVTSWICESSRPQRIAYLSCNAGTLARDLSLFTQSGYAVERISPYDFFPQTRHVETLACLARK